MPKVHYPRIPLDTRLMARVSMDIKEMPKSILGYNCILVCVCVNTQIGCEYGTPKAIICDEGPALTSDLIKCTFMQ